MPKKEYSYGSVEDGSIGNNSSGNNKKKNGVEAEKDGGGDDFNETDLLYVTSQGRSLTPEERRMKFIKIAVPIIVAVILIGGLALFLLHGFANLYPGPSGSSSSDNNDGGRSPTYNEPLHKTPAPTTTSKLTSKSSSLSVSSSSSTPTSSSLSSSSSSSPSCSDNSKCSAAGLTGLCCPTVAGDMLDCCS